MLQFSPNSIYKSKPSLYDFFFMEHLTDFGLNRLYALMYTDLSPPKHAFIITKPESPAPYIERIIKSPLNPLGMLPLKLHNFTSCLSEEG